MSPLRALSAELLKIKRTLALRLAILAPAAMVLLQVILFQQRQESLLRQDSGEIWLTFGQQTLMFWTLLMLPLFITLETALVSALEHNNQQLKHLFALPVPRAAIYAAKWFVGMAVVALAMAALYVFIILGGQSLRLLAPGLGFENPVPWGIIAWRIAMAYLASWLIISIHLWIGMRWQSFVVACAAGIILTIAGTMIIQSDWGSFYPWALPGILINRLGKGSILWPQLIFGCMGGIPAAVLGGRDVIRRDVL